MANLSGFDRAQAELGARARRVLYAVVTEFIQTGEPVGSRTLSTQYGLDLSAATIRNVLKDLEEGGYLRQPHTSAGRVPTRHALQLFIDALMQVRQLPAHHAAQIRELFSADLAHGDLLHQSGRLLSELSGLPAVVLRSSSETRSVVKIRFIAHRPQELLSVVILDDGSVENRFIQLDEPIDAAKLERVHNLLDEVTSGRTLVELRGHLDILAKKQRDELGALGQLGDRLIGSALQGSMARRDVIVEGRSTLFSRADDPERIKDLMVALEDREQLVELLDRTLSSTHVQVFLGQEQRETGQEEGSPLSLVAAPYARAGNSPAGAVGTVGPPRMDYPGLVPLVETMARALSRSLEQIGAPSTESSSSDGTKGSSIDPDPSGS